MMVRRLLVPIMLLLGVMTVSAQTLTPTPTPLGSLITPTATFPPSPTPGITLTPDSPDPRLAICTAPFQPGWLPYRVYRNDRLADLLVGVDDLTITQIAALNCLDDPAALPVGAVIWLPPNVARNVPQVEPDETNQQPAKILEFTASEKTVPNVGKGITLSWKAAGRLAYFYICPGRPEYTCEPPLDVKPVPLGYVTEPITNFRYAGPVRFRLEVRSGVGAETVIVHQDVIVEVVCAYEAMNEVAGFQACPIEPVSYRTVAWQPFEHGVMMWRSDTREIWVMTDDNHLQVFADTYQESEPDPIATPPKGREVPIRGFGKVWQELGGADSVLGWATGREDGYEAGWQRAGQYSYTTFVGGPRQLYAITLVPGSSTGYWAQIR